MRAVERLARVVTEHSGGVVVAMVLLTAALGAGLPMVEESSSMQGVSGDSEVARAGDAVQQNFTARAANTTTLVVAVTDDGGNVLSRDSLLRSLRYQQRLRANDTLNATLADERPTVGLANLVATAAMAEEDRWETGRPPLDEQVARLAAMDDAEVRAVVTRLLDPERETAATRTAHRLLARDYEPGSTTADARMVVVTQETEGAVRAAPAISERVSQGQVAARQLALETAGPESYRVLGRGLLGRQQGAAIEDSLGLLGPLAVLFVLFALSAAYRDPVDVALGLIGVGVVLVWTFGAAGWLGVQFGQTMIAAPILLIGLSVDYAFHVVMRYREARSRDGLDVREAMADALVGVGPALALVTATTAIGFLANLTSPLGGIRDFGVVTAVGIVATLAVFGLLVPALKTLTATWLARRGRERTPAPPGSNPLVGRVLAGGATLARRAPAAVVLVALLVSAGGAYGAADVEVSASQELFMADDPPAWTAQLPEAVEPGEYYLKENRRYVYDRFQSPDQQASVLVEGTVTAPGTLDRIDAAGRRLADSAAAVVGADGDPAVETPLTAIRIAAERNDSFAATVTAADADGDGVPDRNLTAVYDGLYGAAPTLAARTVHRTDDGAYHSLRLRMAMHGDAERAIAVETLRDSAATVGEHGGLTATATGTQVVEEANTNHVSTSMVRGLAITLVVILSLLVLVFRLREGAATLGALTLVPVAFTVTWLLGTMALLEFPISPVTSLVGSIAVGLGVDYAIHVSERFAEERREGADLQRSLARTVTGTGSAMVSSAVTTAAGFGVLSFALLPGLRQFGFILAVGIVYAFVATVLVQPSLLALWDRFGSDSSATVETGTTTGDD